MLYAITLPLLLAAARTVSAVGCETHTYGTCADGIVHWYDPDDGMICDPLDCGGGRAPPKTNNPCCGNYKGTAQCVTTPSFMPCFGSSKTSTSAGSTPTKPTITESSASYGEPTHGSSSAASESSGASATPTPSTTSSVASATEGSGSSGATESGSAGTTVFTTSAPLPSKSPSSSAPSGGSASNGTAGTGSGSSAPIEPVGSNDGARGVRYDLLMLAAGVVGGAVALL